LFEKLVSMEILFERVVFNRAGYANRYLETGFKAEDLEKKRLKVELYLSAPAAKDDKASKDKAKKKKRASNAADDAFEDTEEAIEEDEILELLGADPSPSGSKRYDQTLAALQAERRKIATELVRSGPLRLIRPTSLAEMEDASR
jgi:hypothetical protein